MLLLDIYAIKSLLKATGLEKFNRQLINQLETDFSHWNEFSKTPRHATHYKHGVIELMPCSSQHRYSFKYVNGHPYNTRDGNLCVAAMGLLADVQSGYPLMISEMTILTAIRTAAVTALGAKYLARKNASKLSIIGTGSQAEFQAIAVKSLFPIDEVNIYDIDDKAMEKFDNNLSSQFKSIKQHTCVSDCVKNADIVITATAAKKSVELFSKSDIQPGTHIHAMGGDCPGKTELGIELLKNSKLIVEFSEQSLIEGEVQQLDADSVYAELWQIITQEKPGRENNTEITIFDSVGFALEDFSTLNLVYDLSKNMDIGEEIDLVPSLEDPKNLYGFLL